MRLDKDLVAASATPLILTILSSGGSYGYAIIKEVEHLSGQEIQWTEGMLYPVLHRLERNGVVASFWDTGETGRRRKYYRLTEAGAEELERLKHQWDFVDGVLRTSWNTARGGPRAHKERGGSGND